MRFLFYLFASNSCRFTFFFFKKKFSTVRILPPAFHHHPTADALGQKHRWERSDHSQSSLKFKSVALPMSTDVCPAFHSAGGHDSDVSLLREWSHLTSPSVRNPPFVLPSLQQRMKDGSQEASRPVVRCCCKSLVKGTGAGDCVEGPWLWCCFWKRRTSEAQLTCLEVETNCQDQLWRQKPKKQIEQGMFQI